MGSWHLVRHGETDWNLQGRTKVDCAGLSVIGNQPNVCAPEFWNDTNHLTSTVRGGAT